jgi:hypothetical protein
VGEGDLPRRWRDNGVCPIYGKPVLFWTSIGGGSMFANLLKPVVVQSKTLKENSIPLSHLWGAVQEWHCNSRLPLQFRSFAFFLIYSDPFSGPRRRAGDNFDMD